VKWQWVSHHLSISGLLFDMDSTTLVAFIKLNMWGSHCQLYKCLEIIDSSLELQCRVMILFGQAMQARHWIHDNLAESWGPRDQWGLPQKDDDNNNHHHHNNNNPIYKCETLVHFWLLKSRAGRQDALQGTAVAVSKIG